jgi:putative transposase
MTNHVHLLLTSGATGSCGRLMRDLGRCYVRYFNDRYARSGTLWEGRFRSCVVESAAYVLACYRYIELNPVRAGMVPDPVAYPWSSHAHNVGVRADPMIRPHTEFSALAERPHSVYRALVAEPLGDALLRSIREATEGGYPLVSEAFKQLVMSPLGVRTGPGKPGRTTVGQLRP